MAKVKELLVSEREVIERISLITGHGKDIVRDVINAHSEFVIDEISNGIPVRIGKLGEMDIKEHHYAGGYDFAHKCMGTPSTSIVVKFYPSKRLREAARNNMDNK